MSRISSYQAAALMLCFTVARLIAYRPEGDSLIMAAAAELLACLGMFLVSIPLSKLPSAGGFGGRVMSFAAAGYCLFALTLILADFADAMQYSFPGFYSPGAMILALASAAAYSASMGLQGCARAACAAVILALLTFALMTLGACEGIDPERLNIAVPDRGGQLSRQLTGAFARSAELPMLLILMRRRTAKPIRAAAVYFAVRALLWCVTLALCASVLGELGGVGEPFWSLAAFAKTSVVERFDALVMLFWTLCTLLSAAALIICFGERLSELMPGLSKYAPAAVILPAVTAYGLIYAGFSRPAAVIPAAASGIGAAAASFCHRRSRV